MNSRKLPVTTKTGLKKDHARLFSTIQISVSLKTGSLLTKALSSLMKKEIIEKNKIYKIQDIVFKKWLQKIYQCISQ